MSSARKELGISTLSTRQKVHLAQTVYKCLRIFDISMLIQRCENFGHFYSLIIQLVEASERQTMA